jgi:hypothetical protein
VRGRERRQRRDVVDDAKGVGPHPGSVEQNDHMGVDRRAELDRRHVEGRTHDDRRCRRCSRKHGGGEE